MVITHLIFNLKQMIFAPRYLEFFFVLRKSPVLLDLIFDDWVIVTFPIWLLNQENDNNTFIFATIFRFLELRIQLRLENTSWLIGPLEVFTIAARIAAKLGK